MLLVISLSLVLPYYLFQGESNVIGGIKIAHLALKHRQNRNHKMRIVVFIGSPVNCIDRNEVI